MPYMYILEYSDKTYYTGSTWHLEQRIEEHNSGTSAPLSNRGANYTSKRLPVKLVYFEEYSRIEDAFKREKQVQGWTKKKKAALILGKYSDLHKLSECVNSTHYSNVPSAPLRDQRSVSGVEPTE